MDRLEIYYDHYKETFALSKEAQNRRNKFFLILCVAEALSFLLLVKPDTAEELVNESMGNYFETVLSLGIETIQSLLWIIKTYFFIRYCQDTLYVERQYGYLDKLERKISEEFKGNLFGREGENYLKDYPIVLNFIDLFYKMFCPILFTVINIARICCEWINCSGKISLRLVCDTAIFIAIFVISWFYFFELHSKITAWCKRHIPFVDKIANWLKKILKEV